MILSGYLPALPKEWDRGYINNILCRGGHEISIKWDMNLGEIFIDILGKSTAAIKIKLPKRILNAYPNDITVKEDVIDMDLCENSKASLKIIIAV